MVCCLHTLLHLNVCLYADAIATRWAENGISGEVSDVELVVHVLSGQRKFKLIVVTSHYLYTAKQFIFVFCRCVAEGPHQKSGRPEDDGNM